jgi:hypothetical protein
MPERLQNLGLCLLLGPLSREDLYRATPVVTWGLGFSGLIRRIQSPLTIHKGMKRTYSNPDPQRFSKFEGTKEKNFSLAVVHYMKEETCHYFIGWGWG